MASMGTAKTSPTKYRNGVNTMQSNKLATRVALGTRVWRDLGQLAAEAAVIGVLFSLLLAVAVFVMARDNRSDTTRPAMGSAATQRLIAAEPVA
jgi:hypothetical protein